MRPPLRTARTASRSPMLLAVAEEVAARSDIPALHAIRILLSIVRALGAPPTREIHTVDDVTWLTLHAPDQFERLLRGYWLLLGRRSALE
jgi:hypothetical protein